MNAFNTYPVTDIKIFAGLGCIVWLCLICIPVLGFGYAVYEQRRMVRCEGFTSQVPECAPGPLWSFLKAFQDYDNAANGPSSLDVPQVDLGAEGGICGGSEHFPCFPGLECHHQPDEEYGECVPAKQNGQATTTSVKVEKITTTPSL